MNRCLQIVAYTIRPDALASFDAVKTRVAAEAHALPGLLRSTTTRSSSVEGHFVDLMVWETERAARESEAAFLALPSTPSFLALMSGPPRLSDLVAWSAGDDTLVLR